MKQYSYDKIYKMLEPVMDMMKTEYPNDAVLIVQSDFAHISYLHKDMCFSRPFDSGAICNVNNENKRPSSEKTPNFHATDELIHLLKSIINNREVKQ